MRALDDALQETLDQMSFNRARERGEVEHLTEGVYTIEDGELVYQGSVDEIGAQFTQAFVDQLANDAGEDE